MKFWKYLFLILFLAGVTVWLSVVFFPDEKLHVVTCDVGQGDAILLVFGQSEILIDGGPNNKVLNCLSKHLPFWDRTLEAVFLTHLQKDHYLGLIDIFERYQVNYFFVNDLESSDQDLQVLKNIVGGSRTKVVGSTSGQKIGNNLIYLDIIWPPENLKIGEINESSIVAILHFNKFSALITGDIDSQISSQLSQNPRVTQTTLLKIPHHGSKNGLTEDLLEIVKPEIAVISVGKNSYGHPHQEILDLLSGYDIRILRTDTDGEIEVVTDGRNWSVKKK